MQPKRNNSGKLKKKAQKEIFFRINSTQFFYGLIFLHMTLLWFEYEHITPSNLKGVAVVSILVNSCDKIYSHPLLFFNHIGVMYSYLY